MSAFEEAKHNGYTGYDMYGDAYLDLIDAGAPDTIKQYPTANGWDYAKWFEDNADIINAIYDAEDKARAEEERRLRESCM